MQRFRVKAQKFLSIFFAAVGLLLTEIYLITVIPPVVSNAPDKSMIFWLAGFLLLGLYALKFSFILWQRP
jgi:hypothetical protein